MKRIELNVVNTGKSTTILAGSKIEPGSDKIKLNVNKAITIRAISSLIATKQLAVVDITLIDKGASRTIKSFDADKLIDFLSMRKASLQKQDIKDSKSKEDNEVKADSKGADEVKEASKADQPKEAKASKSSKAKKSKKAKKSEDKE